MRRAALLVLAATLAAGCAGGSSDRAPEAVASSAAGGIKDALLTAALKAQLTAADPDSATTLGVAAHDGAVTLRGAVRSARILAGDVAAARDAPGVRSVDASGVRIDAAGPRPKERVSDFALATRVSAALVAQLGFTHIVVRVEGGTAYLDGAAPNRKAAATAVATARGTSGVRNVVDRLRVEHP